MISILYPFEAFNDFCRKYFYTIKEMSTTSYDFIISFQTFCANQSPTSYVVEVQSQAENDWLVTLSKNCPMKSHNMYFFIGISPLFAMLSNIIFYFYIHPYLSQQLRYVCVNSKNKQKELELEGTRKLQKVTCL